MSTLSISTNASVRDRTESPGDHGSIIASGFIVLVLICLAAVISLLGTVTPPDMGLLVGPV
jgi:hypothetical protein